MIRLLLADDQALVRGALAALLSLESDLEVVAEVERGDLVVPTALRRATRRGACSTSRCRGWTASPRPPRCARRCRAAGCSSSRPSAGPATSGGRWRPARRGFLVKDAPAEQLADAIRRVHAGPACRRPGARRRDAGQRGVAADRPGARRARRRPAAARSPTSPGCSSSARAPCATTCRRRWARPAPAPAPRPCSSPRSAAGSRPHARDVTVRFHVLDASGVPRRALPGSFVRVPAPEAADHAKRVSDGCSGRTSHEAGWRPPVRWWWPCWSGPSRPRARATARPFRPARPARPA